MHTKDIEILSDLVAAIQSGSIDERFPSDRKGSVHAIYLGLKEIYRQRHPHESAVHPALTEKVLVDTLDAWPMKDLLNFIKIKGNELPKLVHERLLGMVDSTATLGADAVLHLVDLEMTLAKKRGAKPREELIAHFIGSYGGRINLMRGLTRGLIEHFPESKLIDAALAGHVPVHRMKDRSFFEISTCSDLLLSVHYPQTLRACLECLVEEDSEHKFQFFNDHASGRMPAWALSLYVELLGHDECLEQAGRCFKANYRDSIDGVRGPFESYIEQFGSSALINTEAMVEELEMDEQRGMTSSFFKWYAQRMPIDVPEYTERAIPLVPAMIKEDGKLPCSGFIFAWKNSRSPELFLAEFLEALGVRQTQKGSVNPMTRNFQDFEKLLPVFDESVSKHSPAALVHGAYSPGSGINEICIAIKAALVMAGIPAIGKVIPTLSPVALRGLCQSFGPKQHAELMRVYPKASEFVMAVDLGL